VSKRHPTEDVALDPLDGPAHAETAVRLVQKLGLTEREAQALLDAPGVSAEEVQAAPKANIPAIAAAFSEDTVEAMVTDPKLDLGTYAADLRGVAARVRVNASATQKLLHLHDEAYAASRVDAGTLQSVDYIATPQIVSRARVSSGVRRTYSPLLAYHHVRSPGRHGGGHSSGGTGGPSSGTGPTL
jgi:hypothetical protein